MRRSFRRRWLAGSLIFLASAAIVAAQTSPSLKDILSKNIEAAGGKAKLAQVKNLSFRIGRALHVVSAGGELKIVTGRDPVITEAVLIAGGKAVRNSFGVVSEVTGPQATVYQTLAKLYAGLFSLAKFEGQLELVGVKSFGPEKLYHLSLKGSGGPVAVHFYLRADDFLLKRLVFLGTTPDGDKYEVNYDFGPFEEVDGFKVPLSWFDSRVGTRGNLTEMSEVKANAALDKDFFEKAETNIGRTEASPGQLKGNILDWNASPFGLTIVTNWTRKDIDAAGLRTGDKLVLLIGEEEYALAFYAQSSELPSRDELAKVGRLLAPMQRGGETFAIQVMGEEGGALAAKLTPLAALSAKKATN
ncbi:MAG: hypothetical protein H6P96_107 [Candidatus Aminicenantes bacterium]|nr:hypothetical protein [Candidatus Aminicenantes bacterium]